MKVKLIIISIILLLVMVFASGCIPIMEKLGLVSPTNEEQLSPEKGGPPDGLVKVLIGFKEKPGAAQQALVKGVGGQIKYTYHIVDAIAASIPEKAIVALQNNPNVTHVELDGEIFAIDETLPWGVERIDAEVVHASGNKGAEVDVAILDTGIDVSHPDLNVVDGANFSPGKKSYDDGNGHGTHVAGIVAALDNNNIGVIGVAPEVNLYAVKVLGDRGIGRWSDLIAGLQWCVDYPIQIANMSLGATSAPSDVKAACDSAYAAGVLLVAAAGNENSGSVIYPAAYDSVIAVSATDSADKLASFSSVGDEVELAAPGVYIYSTYKDGGYATYSGTSMASPHVAGTAALVICSGVVSDGDGAYGIANEVRARLFDTAQDIGLLLDEQGNGLVDAENAVLGTTGGDDLPSTATGTIRGTVTDIDTEEPIGEGLVTANGYSTSTDANGIYTLADLPVDSYTVTASADGYYSETATVTIEKDGIVTQDFTLQAIPTYLVSGTVTDAVNYVLEGVTVTIEETGQSATTGSDGTYAIPDVEEDTYNITASKEGYSSQTTENVTVNKDIAVDFVLEEITEELQKMYAASIGMWYRSAGPNRFVSTKVEIVSSDSTAVSGATVYLETTLPDNSIVSGSGDTADDGTITFEIKSRQTGTYTSDVKNVKKVGWTYDSDANSETSDSIDVE